MANAKCAEWLRTLKLEKAKDDWHTSTDMSESYKMELLGPIVSVQKMSYSDVFQYLTDLRRRLPREAKPDPASVLFTCMNAVLSRSLQCVRTPEPIHDEAWPCSLSYSGETQKYYFSKRIVISMSVIWEETEGRPTPDTRNYFITLSIPENRAAYEVRPFLNVKIPSLSEDDKANDVSRITDMIEMVGVWLKTFVWQYSEVKKPKKNHIKELALDLLLLEPSGATSAPSSASSSPSSASSSPRTKKKKFDKAEPPMSPALGSKSSPFYRYLRSLFDSKDETIVVDEKTKLFGTIYCILTDVFGAQGVFPDDEWPGSFNYSHRAYSFYHIRVPPDEDRPSGKTTVPFDVATVSVLSNDSELFLNVTNINAGRPLITKIAPELVPTFNDEDEEKDVKRILTLKFLMVAINRTYLKLTGEEAVIHFSTGTPSTTGVSSQESRMEEDEVERG